MERPAEIAKRTKLNRDCWDWCLALDKDGYGRKSVGSRKIMAHRWTYEMLVGPIPKGKQIDHLCRNRACVNPAHLEPVTSQENSMRGNTVQARNAAKSHCDSGHSLSGENLYIDPRGWRGCKTCRREAVKRNSDKVM